MSTASAWNPRFLAHAQSRGMTPEQVRDADCVAFPGGRMAGFICWNSARVREFVAETGADRRDVTRLGSYDAWLAARFGAAQLELPLEVS
ncbi:hypothetical protein CFB81_22415 [Burkholderia sp. AU28863]|uniref:hypothetical protein n=1 Tax=Burkholderia sp. AU28863 TaxID=2015352 RepID=UPI000B7A01A4|nr:hypothetical protein [Burkholderia sp. AU28863]OXI67415.1 hypothetical protein CFB81_22415 [Burkholderia sp. AU28863]